MARNDGQRALPLYRPTHRTKAARRSATGIGCEESSVTTRRSTGIVSNRDPQPASGIMQTTSNSPKD
jgi:hypothetical protein